ncbi:MAG: nitroreductase/quinone reductase family protein [Acidimicrobiia bacterium]|jgi:hypothetical protein
MAETAMAEVQVPLDKPPGWANAWMIWALKTPGIQRMVGQGVALLSFTGRRSGNPYTIPVSYHREADVVTVITKRPRKWWHNFESPTEVELRLAGETYAGRAEIWSDQEEAVDFMTEYLKKRPVDARAYGLAKDERVREKIAKIVPQLVLIRIDLA